MVSENNSDPQLGSKSERSLHSCLVCSSAQYAFFICSFLHFVCGSISFLHFWKNAPPDFSSFIVESNESCAVKSARLMSKGCDLLELSNFWDGHGTLTFSHAVTVDEFVVEFLQCENIPSVKILGSANNWVTNYTIVSTASHSGGLTQRWHRAPGKTRISLHPHQPWPWILDHLLHHLLLCLCFLSLGASLAKDAAACFSVGLARLNGASAVGCAALRRWQETPLPAWRAPPTPSLQRPSTSIPRGRPTAASCWARRGLVRRSATHLRGAHSAFCSCHRSRPQRWLLLMRPS